MLTPRFSTEPCFSDSSNLSVLRRLADYDSCLIAVPGSAKAFSACVVFDYTDFVMPSNRLVLFQVPNRIGLGHINRMSCVALALREMKPDVQSLFLIEGSSHGFLESVALPYLMLPNSDVVSGSPAWSSWSQDSKKSFMRGLAESMLNVLEPELVVYDCFPNIHFAEAVLAAGIKTVICIRKVKDFELYARDPRVRSVLDSDAFILVPHAEEEFPLPETLKSRATYVGTILKTLPVDPKPLQVRLNLPGKRIVVINAGGGGYPGTVEFLNLSLRAFAKVKRKHRNLVALLVPGPLFSGWADLELVSGVRIVPFDPEFTLTCATADLVLSQAGYNSINELARLGTPTICIPAERGFDDQFERARGMAEVYGNIDSLENASMRELVERMEEVLDRSVERVRRETPDGAYRAAFVISQLLHRNL